MTQNCKIWKKSGKVSGIRQYRLNWQYRLTEHVNAQRIIEMKAHLLTTCAKVN